MESKTLHFGNPRLLNQLYAGNNDNLAKAEKALGVKIVTREDWLQVEGAEEAVGQTEDLFNLLRDAREQGLKIKDYDFQKMLETICQGDAEKLHEVFDEPCVLKFKRKSIVPKTVNQKRYLQKIDQYDVVFGIGPAGTGKTYLAVAAAMHALVEKNVERIILTRPAVEAGEALGFLPGDLQEKLLPYLRPLYDAMYDMLGPEDTAKFMEKKTIEIAPLAYMRGRTLSNAFVILDEAQNTTAEQMMMFLTRLGEGSKMIITGDITQIDLPRSRSSGLVQALRILKNVEGLETFYFEEVDVVRHPLVSRIIRAYTRHHEEQEQEQEARAQSRKQSAARASHPSA